MANLKAGLNGVQTRFATDRDEPLVKQLQIRVPESLSADLKAIPNWQEFARKALLKAIAERQRRSALTPKSNKT